MLSPAAWSSLFISGEASPTMSAAFLAESAAFWSSSWAVPKFSEVTAETALLTWDVASFTAASKSDLLTQPPDAEADAAGEVAAGGVEVDEDVLEHATRTITSAAAIPQRCIGRFCMVDPQDATEEEGPGSRIAPERIRTQSRGSLRRWFRDMPNLYLIQKTDNAPDEVSADFYERQGDDWVFMLGGAEVARLEIESIVSIAKAPRDFG